MAGAARAGAESHVSAVLSEHEKRAQVHRIVTSAAFRNATVLQSLLEHLTSKSLDHDTEGISEYAIATQVFGRPATFNPASDTIVRTQIYRLRSKLKDYYESEGAKDPVRLEIPKGHYVPVFSWRDSEIKEGSAPDAAGRGEGRPLPRRISVRPGFLAGAAILLVLSGVLLGRLALSGRRDAARPEPPDAAVAFWTSFLGVDREVVIAYSNAVFLDTDGGDLLRFRDGATADRGAIVTRQDAKENVFSPQLLQKAGPLFYEDGYTGTGEVSGAFRIATLLTRMGATPVAKRSRMMNIYDLRSHNAVFLGSTFQNASLTEVAQPDHFAFEEPKSAPFLWRSRIVNKHPRGGEASFYQTERAPDTRVVKADYAIFGVLPGPAPDRRVMVLAGLTTSGTQGAADFACSPAAMASFRKKLGSGGAFPRYFQCVLRVETARGLDPMEVHLLAARVIQREEP